MMVWEPESGSTAKAAVAPEIVSWFAHLGWVAAIVGGSRALRAAVPKAGVAPDVASALADADACIVHNDWPQWRDLTAEDFTEMRRRSLSTGGVSSAAKR